MQYLWAMAVQALLLVPTAYMSIQIDRGLPQETRDGFIKLWATGGSANSAIVAEFAKSFGARIPALFSRDMVWTIFGANLFASVASIAIALWAFSVSPKDYMNGHNALDVVVLSVVFSAAMAVILTYSKWHACWSGLGTTFSFWLVFVSSFVAGCFLLKAAMLLADGFGISCAESSQFSLRLAQSTVASWLGLGIAACPGVSPRNQFYVVLPLVQTSLVLLPSFIFLLLCVLNMTIRFASRVAGAVSQYIPKSLLAAYPLTIFTSPITLSLWLGGIL